jgi:hypothetical protein
MKHSHCFANIARTGTGMLLASFATISFAATWQSQLVTMDAGGNLTYNIDPASGSKIADFSHAGYHGGDIPLPNVGAGSGDIPVKVTVSATTGDNTALIQDAINQVSAMPMLASGYRGAVRLSSGTFTISGTLVISESGVVLAGSGTDTVIRNTFSGTDSADAAGYTIITARGNVSGNPFNNNLVSSSSTAITTGTVPVGSYSFEVASASGYAVGDLVLVVQPWTDAWLATINYGGTDTIGYGGATTNNVWTPSSGTNRYQRYIKKIEGNTITLDAPVYENLTRDLAPSYLIKYSATGTSNYKTHIGIENLLIENVYASNTDENHAANSIVFKRTQDCWARNVTTRYFSHAGIMFMDASTRATVMNCSAIDPKGVATGGRFYNFGTERAQLILFTKCHARGARHSYICNGTALDNGIVFHDSVGDKCVATTEAHRFWCNGILYDNVRLTNVSTTWALGLYNRGSMGTSHGWAAVHSVAWNCAVSNSRKISIQRPLDTGPTNAHGAQNYAIGCMIYTGTGVTGSLTNSGTFVTGQGAFNNSYITAGHIEGTNQAGLEPASLYTAQLDARLNASVITAPAIAWASGGGSQTVQAGATATFTANLTAGSTPFTFTWSKSGTLLTTGTTSSAPFTYTTPATTPADNGATYQIAVSNVSGTATLNATLNVTSNSAFDAAQQIKNQLEAPGAPDAAPITVTGAIDLSLVGGATLAPGKTIMGTDVSATLTGPLTIPADAGDTIILGVTFINSSLTITGASDVTVTNCTFTDTPVLITGGADGIVFTWNKFTATPAAGTAGSAMLIDNAGAGAVILLQNNLWGQGLRADMPAVTNARVHMLNNYFTATGNTTATIAAAGAQILSENNIYQGVNNPLVTQSGGLLRALGNFMTAITGTTAPGNDQVFVPGYSYLMNPAGIDTPSAADLVNRVSACAGNTDGKNSATPTATNATADITATSLGTGADTIAGGVDIPAGSGAMLIANANGFAPATRQWYRNNFPIAEATAANYAITNASASVDAGAYVVAQTTAAGEIVASPAFIVTVPPSSLLSILPNAAQSIGANAGTLTFTVMGGPGVSWTAAMAAGSSWARITVGAGGDGNGTITVSYDANPRGGAQRSTTLTLSASGQTIPISIIQATNTGSGGDNDGGGGAPSLLWLGALALLLRARRIRKK